MLHQGKIKQDSDLSQVNYSNVKFATFLYYSLYTKISPLFTIIHYPLSAKKDYQLTRRFPSRYEKGEKFYFNGRNFFISMGGITL